MLYWKPVCDCEHTAVVADSLQGRWLLVCKRLQTTRQEWCKPKTKIGCFQSKGCDFGNALVAAVRDGFYLVKVCVALSEFFTIALIPRGAAQQIKSFSKSNFANVKIQREDVDVFWKAFYFWRQDLFYLKRKNKIWDIIVLLLIINNNNKNR